MQRLVVLALFALITLLTGTTESEADAIANWNFDNCTAQDASGHGLNGTIQGTATCVTGISGKALSFTGNSGYVEVSDDIRLSPPTSLTLEAAVKPTSLDNIYNSIIHKQDTNAVGYSLILYSDLGIQLSISFEGETSQSTYLVYGSGIVPLNQWSRIKAEVDAVAGKVRIYVNDVMQSIYANGVYKLEQDCPHSHILAVTGPVRIGAGDLSMAQYGFYTNLNGAIDEVKISTSNALLTTTLTGTGGGAVNSLPSGIACTTSPCLTYFAAATPITLLATPDANSAFGGWSGACTNKTGDCDLAMNTSSSVSALFTTTLPVKLVGTPDRYFESVSNAYTLAPTGGTATILARGAALAEDVVLDRAITVKLKGGYDSTFGAVVGRTVLSGTLTVGQGSLIVENLVIESASSPIVSSTPLEGATKVAVTTPIEVRLGRSVDPATISSATVTLLGKGRFGFFNVPGWASYDAAQKLISFKTGVLPPGCSYILKLSGLKDPVGNPLPDMTVAFSTLRNQVKETVTYNANGSVRDYALSTFNPAGLPLDFKDYTSAGADGIWFTTDDVLGANATNDYTYNYATQKYTLADASSYFGLDDVLWTDYTFDPSDNLTDEAYYGDTDLGHTTYSYDNRGFLLQVTRFNDDYSSSTVMSYTVSVYDAQGNKVQDITYNSRNPDGTPLPGDTVARYSTYALDAEGRLSRIVTYDNTGPDGIWFTADDGVSGYWDFTYGTNGQLTRSAYHGAPGADGTWFTADDVQLAYIVYHYDTAGNRTERIRYVAPGSDGVWFTADDTRSVVDTYDTTW